LDAVERAGVVTVIYVSETLGLETAPRPRISQAQAAVEAVVPSAQVKFEIHSHDLDRMRERSYWKIKRLFDVVVALFALVLIWPVILLVGVLVAVSIGFPLVFWQQRPGLGGRSFRLYKFRSMRAAQTPDGRKLSDAERVSGVGSFLRRTRLDELPQLFNILRGEMSFIGPRPLLPRDQDISCRARLLVRPGLTGWAQIVGGRSISPDDKAALDIWYVKNASISLDLMIALRTVPIILKGERTSESLIRSAWRDLLNSGVLKQDVSGNHRAKPRIRAA
jgi:lipopolysaccharide/colanic/teichoic acid biosynthesis glycosyltransferase